MLKVKAGDRQAFEQLYEKFKGPIMSYVHALVQNSTLAEEITQETFLKAYRVRATYQPSAKLTTWLWTIARNATMDQLRRRKEAHFADPSDEDATGMRLEDVESTLTTAEEQLVEAADRRRVEACMAALSDQQREALTLRTVSELSYEEIAEAMGTSLSSVKSLIFRAKNALMECLGGGA